MKLFKKIKKGFTLVELVVVIAVIAILSAVSVAAYTGVTSKAKESKAMQEARAAYMVWLAQEVNEDKDPTSINIDISHGGYWFNVASGEFSSKAYDSDHVTAETSPNYTLAGAGNAGLKKITA